jgi:hypothetical protein
MTAALAAFALSLQQHVQLGKVALLRPGQPPLPALLAMTAVLAAFVNPVHLARLPQVQACPQEP